MAAVAVTPLSAPLGRRLRPACASRARIRIRTRTRVTVQCTCTAASSSGFGEGEGFTQCGDKLAAMGLSEEETTKVLKEAFGWSKQTYWRKSKVEEVPSLDAIEDVLGVLADVGLNDSEVLKVISDFPEVLGCSGKLVADNVEHVQKTFFVRNKALIQTLSRKVKIFYPSQLTNAFPIRFHAHYSAFLISFLSFSSSK